MTSVYSSSKHSVSGISKADVMFSCKNDSVLCSTISAKHSTSFPELDFKSTGIFFEHVLTFTLDGDVRKVFGMFCLEMVRDARGDLFILFDVEETLLVMLKFQAEVVGHK